MSARGSKRPPQSSSKEETPTPFGEVRLRRLMEAAPDAMVLTNKEGLIVLVNGQAERLFGYERGEMLNRPVEMLIPARYRNAHPMHRRKYFGQQHARPMGEGGVVLFGLRKDGSEFPAEISLSPLDGDNEEDPIAIAAVRDVTEQRKAEAERVKLSQAQEAIRLRDEFLSIASHELRTPLTPIQLQIDGALRAARRGGEQDLDMITRKLEGLSNGIHRLSSLVNQLLDLSRITSGRLDLERGDIDLVSLVQRSLLAFEDEAARAECTVELDCQKPELRGRWDSSRLEQVLTNLLSNALRYGAGGPVSIVLAELKPGWVTLLVRDHGIGIAPEHHQLVFQRFERVAEARNRGGFGLGLWIVRQIVEAHGGRITVFSRPGIGTTFAVELPTMMEETDRAAEPSILLVDDDAAVRANFRKQLGNRVPWGATAASGFDALALLHFGLRPDLIALDVDMPVMDGPSFFAEVSRDPRFAEIPIVWLRDENAAGRPPPDNARSLRKPFAPTQLRQLLERQRG